MIALPSTTPPASTAHEQEDQRHRLNRLDETGDELRRTHFGLDATIDRILESIGPWYLFPAAQERPRVLCLWGMTGTGKSSLIRRLIEALDIADRTFWLDAGQNTMRDWFNDPLMRIGTHFNGEPFVLVMDEFQHARTVVDGFEKQESGPLRAFWELLDSGRCNVWPGIEHLSDLRELCIVLKDAIDHGVEVRDGRVVKGKAAFTKVMNGHGQEVEEQDGRRWFVPPNARYILRHQFMDGERSEVELRAILTALDGPETLALVERILVERSAMRTVDGSKALVIVLGNLDELYVMGKELLPELDPDVLVHRHQRLSRSGVHDALARMFRIEQVGRLGADHALFPPMGRTTIRQLVRAQADELADRLRTRTGTIVEVGGGLVERIASGAAAPVLGARPLIAAVHRMVPALLSQVLQHGARTGRRFDHIRLDQDNAGCTALASEGNDRIAIELRDPAGHNTTPYRPGNAQRMHYAVHEAGHLVAGLALRDGSALQACACTSDPSRGGFVIWDAPAGGWFTRGDLVPQIAMLLAGLLAERVCYGKDGVVAGSSDDLYKASSLALNAAKEEGFGNDLLTHAEHPTALGSGLFRRELAGVEEQARQWIEEAERLCVGILEREHLLFHAFIDALRTQPSLNAEAIAALVQCHGTDDLRQRHGLRAIEVIEEQASAH